MLVNVLQQFAGINVLVYYSGIIFHQIGFSERDSLLARYCGEKIFQLSSLFANSALALERKSSTIFNLTFSAAATIPQLFCLAWVAKYLDLFGRKKILLTSVPFLILSMFGLGFSMFYPVEIRKFLALAWQVTKISLLY